MLMQKVVDVYKRQPVLCTEDPILGGAVFHEKDITVSDEPGLGIKGVEKITYLD